MRWIIALAFVLQCASARAYALRQYSFDELAKKADIVAVGAESAHGDNVANIIVYRVLKGQQIAQFELLTKGMIAEATPDCCAKGVRYLMFLTKTKDGYLTSVDGRFGIIPIDDIGSHSALRIVK